MQLNGSIDNLIPIVALAAAVFGAVIGSFLNVVIYRVPRGESVAFPASHCPTCGHPLSALDNIPILGWLMLRGSCRYCRAPIAARYPIVEAANAALWAAAVLHFGVTLDALAACALCSSLLAVLFIDLDHLLIPDTLVVATAVLGAAAAAASGQLADRLWGALAGGALFGLIYLATRGRGMGLGDVKYVAALGLFVGLASAIAMSLASFVIGVVLAVPVLLAGKRGRRDALPFGPFLVIAALAVTFAPGLVYGPYEAYKALLAAMHG